MDLTPEQRRQVYEEERAYMEATRHLTPEHRRRICEEELSRVASGSADKRAEPFSSHDAPDGEAELDHLNPTAGPQRPPSATAIEQWVSNVVDAGLSLRHRLPSWEAMKRAQRRVPAALVIVVIIVGCQLLVGFVKLVSAGTLFTWRAIPHVIVVTLLWSVIQRRNLARLVYAVFILVLFLVGVGVVGANTPTALVAYLAWYSTSFVAGCLLLLPSTAAYCTPSEPSPVDTSESTKAQASDL